MICYRLDSRDGIAVELCININNINKV